MNEINEIIEFKIKQSGVSWEDIPVAYALEILTHIPEERVADSVATSLAKLFGAEVRWNWKGSLQGHYCGGIVRLEPKNPDWNSQVKIEKGPDHKGAWHRAIDVARKLFEAGRWPNHQNTTMVVIDPYETHRLAQYHGLDALEEGVHYRVLPC